jgi:hypothetical protein
MIKACSETRPHCFCLEGLEALVQTSNKAARGSLRVYKHCCKCDDFKIGYRLPMWKEPSKAPNMRLSDLYV